MLLVTKLCTAPVVDKTPRAKHVVTQKECGLSPQQVNYWEQAMIPLLRFNDDQEGKVDGFVFQTL